ncbi:MAG: hypothetical protein JNK46_06645 [Methylobacteriaceae bacterium]|nr:hypothetical protein [Methylobacteriaceae bacterium]
MLLKDGRRLEALGIRHPKGHARNPMTADELFAKFTDCLAQGRATSAPRPLYSSLMALQSLAGVAAIPTITCEQQR